MSYNYAVHFFFATLARKSSHVDHFSTFQCHVIPCFDFKFGLFQHKKVFEGVSCQTQGIKYVLVF
jgi:hypothetical protein